MSNMTSNQRCNWIMNLFRDAEKIEQTVHKDIKGRKVKIISDYKPHGHSKKSLNGKIFEIEDICFGHFHEVPHIKLRGQNLYLGLNEIEFVD